MNYASYIWIFVIAIIVASITAPLSILLANKVGAIDYPGGRRVHKKPITRLGGIAIYCGFWAAVFGTGTLFMDNSLIGLFAGSSVIFLVGLWDDIKGLRPLIKLAWQTLAVVVLIPFGDFTMISFSLPFLGQVNLNALGISALGTALTIFWIVGMVNTVNISDGLDGLAAGICFLAALLLFWSANRIEQVIPAHLTLALAGAALGFLIFNFYPARLIMGDSGSMFLGYIIGGVSIMGLLKTATILGLVFPLLILGLPLSDLTFAIIRRKVQGVPIAKADRGHLHHRLLDAGLSQRQAVLLLYAISACFGLAAVLLATGYWLWSLVLLVMDFSLLLKILFRRIGLLAVFSKRQTKS
jgi:UDP-GlcNAc:undecaprenyl-phosphate GlcNAc-1-phosphate transferase